MTPLLPCLALLAAAAPPRLVVVMVVDQLRMEDLDHYAPLLGPGGLGGLAARGTPFEARYLTANTETGPGHATLATGAYANEHGIATNLAMTEQGPRYVIVDDRYPVWGRATPDGRSPAALRVPTVGDTLKVRSNGKSRVLAVAAKDRSAILTGGFSADLAAWWDPDQATFTSSTYYAAEMPAWLKTFNAAHTTAQLSGYRWDAVRPVSSYLPLTRPDDARAESARLGLPPTLPKTLDPAKVPPGKLGTAARYAPLLDGWVADLALAGADALELGRDDEVDLLWVSFSGYDMVGHAWGPYSVERADTVVRTSANIARLMGELEKRVGRDRLAVVVTSDHGVAPIPEDTAALRIPAGRVAYGDVSAAIDGALDASAGPRDWVKLVSPPNVWLDPAADALPCDVLERAARAALSVDGVATGVSACRLEHLSGMPWEAFKNAHHPVRGGHILVETRPYWIWRDPAEGTGTDHGSTWSYDQRVPVMVVGGGLRPVVLPPGAFVDARQVAPTVAALARCPPPPAARLAPLVGR